MWNTIKIHALLQASGYDRNLVRIHASGIRIRSTYMYPVERQDTCQRYMQDSSGYMQDTARIHCSPSNVRIRQDHEQDATKIHTRSMARIHAHLRPSGYDQQASGYEQDTLRIRLKYVTSVVFWRALQRMPTFEASLWSLVLIRVFAFSPELLSLLLQHGHVHTSRAGAAVDASAQLLLVVVAQGRVFALLQVG